MTALEERVARLEAIEAIKSLKHRYLRACDAKDPQGFRDSFIRQGAAIDYGSLGQYDDADDIVAIYRAVGLERVEGSFVVHDMHHALHPDIELLSPGQARGAWTLRFRQVNLKTKTETVSAIEYDDRYTVEEGQWRISACRSTVLWTFTKPLPEGYVLTESLSESVP